MAGNYVYTPDSTLCGWCGKPATCAGLWSQACDSCCAIHHTRNSGDKTYDRKTKVGKR